MPTRSGRTKTSVRSGSSSGVSKANVRVRPRSATLAKKPDQPVRRTKVWLAFLAVWLAALSGGAAPWTGTPGVLQTLHLRSLLGSKQAEQAQLQTQIDTLREEAGLLEHSKAVQHREIRRVLGYAAEDEIIFDFAGTRENL